MKQATKDKKIEKTRTITFRLPESFVEGLEAESERRQVSTNVLIKQIVEKFLSWDRYSDQMEIIPIPKNILDILSQEMDNESINKLINGVKPFIKESVMYMKGTYDLKRVIETLEDYMRATGMKSDHRVEGSLHHFVIQHRMGIRWSLFVEQLLKEIFHEFLPEKNLKCKTSEQTVVATIALGADFDEHSY